MLPFCPHPIGGQTINDGSIPQVGELLITDFGIDHITRLLCLLDRLLYNWPRPIYQRGASNMPDYILTHFYSDINGGETSKQFVGEFADYATARAAADDFLTDAQAITDAHLFKETLAEVNLIAGTSAATSNVFERISATTDLGSNKKYNLQLPSPIAGVFSGNALIITGTEWVNYTANLGAGLWEVSDGEHIVGTIRGKRQFVRSGNTNLPT